MIATVGNRRLALGKRRRQPTLSNATTCEAMRKRPALPLILQAPDRTERWRPAAAYFLPPRCRHKIKGSIMQIEVGPARRPGAQSSIYDEPLTPENFRLDEKGNVLLTVDANGINCNRSLYRYKLCLSHDEARELVKAFRN